MEKEANKKPISAKEVCRMLKISRPFLHRLTERGTIRKHKLGGKVLFLEDEVWEDFDKV